MIASELRTSHLTLVPASARHIEAELSGPEAFGAFLSAAVPESWPPGEYDEAAQRFFYRCLAKAGDAGVGWYVWYGIRAADAEAPATLVCGGGFFGPPTDGGTVEIGYSVCPEWRHRGYATELVRELVEHALRQAGVERVVAHTHPENPASIRVLERCGFLAIGEGKEAGSLRFVYPSAFVGRPDPSTGSGG
jgi:[ribosomal protein S5]-alanine N-acetyltransferase